MDPSPDPAGPSGDDIAHEPQCPRCGERLDRLRRPWLRRWLDAWHGEARPYYRCRGAHCVWHGPVTRRLR